MNDLRDCDGRSVEPNEAWLMFAELSHRVGNELASALAALRLAQRACCGTAASVDYLDQAVVRLENFGQLHVLLDRNYACGTFNQRLEALCQAMMRSKAAPRGIHVALCAAEVALDEEIAWTICVVACELLTNAFKHAFGEDGGGLVVVDLREECGTLHLSVADNGETASMRGPREPVSPSSGAGWGIVTRLTERLGGAITRQSRSTGTTVSVTVPARPVMQ